MGSEGFVRVHRALLGHTAFRNDAEAMAFAWMVIRASWRPVRVRYKGRSIDLKRGQLAVSQRDMAAALDRDKGWIERFLKRATSEAMIEAVSEAGVNVVTICNYDKFQPKSANGKAADEASEKLKAGQTQGTEQGSEGKEEEIQPNGCMSLGAANDVATPFKPEELLVAWNDMAQRNGLPLTRKLNPKRMASLKARMREFPSMADWQLALDAVARSPFCRGERNGWRASIDFMLQPGSFLKLIEGAYDDGIPQQRH